MEVNVTKKEVVIEAFVGSESKKGMYYKVTSNGNEWECTCPDHVQRGRTCKHIDSVHDKV
jgi:uncharacterized Zn finger protein